MASDAVIIDDGGSTRIKQLRGPNGATGQMDQLMEPGNSDNAHGAFTKFRIQYLDQEGKPGTAFTHDFTPGLTEVTIHSENEQKLTATIAGAVAGGVLTIKLAAKSQNVEPLVHGKQNGSQRRYVVSNAGAIQQVELKKPNEAAPTTIYNTQASPPNPEATSVYTMIVFT
jgi:hypothetical protein